MAKAFFKQTIVKWMGSLALMISLFIIAISIFLYNWYAKDNVKLYSEMAVHVLQNTAKSMEITEKSLVSTGFLTSRDNEISTMMNSRQPSYQTYNAIQDNLTGFLFSNPIASSVYVVNPAADLVLGSPSSHTIDADEYSRFIHDWIASHYPEQLGSAVIQFDTHIPNVEGLTDQKDKLFSYIFFQRRESTVEDSFMIVNVKQADMRNHLLSINPMKESQINAINYSGEPVFSSAEKHHVPQPSQDEAIIHRMMERQADIGFFLHEDNGRRSLVTYVNSDELDLIFFSVTPYHIVRESAIALRLKTIKLSAVILILGIIAAIIIATYFHQPLRKLIHKHVRSQDDQGRASEYGNDFELLDQFIENNQNKAATLNQYVQDNMPVIKQDFFKNVLEGRISLESELATERLQELGSNFTHNHYSVVLFELEQAIKTSPTFKPEADNHLRHALIRLIEAGMKPVCSCEAIYGTHENHVILILNFDSGDERLAEKITRKLQAVQAAAESELTTKPTIAVGRGSSDIRNSYLQAVELLTYKLKYGLGSLIQDGKVNEDIHAYNIYPKSIEQQLLVNFRALNAGLCEKYIVELTEQLYTYSMNDIMRAINQVLYHVLQATKELAASKDASIELDYYGQYNSLMNYVTLSEFQHNLTVYCQHVIEQLKTQDNDRPHTIKKVLDYVESNYHQTSISLEAAAEHIGLNSSYLGKLFKESENIYFTEYVNQLRMNKAKELLLTTNENIASISGMVGFNSTSYFVTCFKKHAGMTPTQFRSNG
ncbi:helix-turn-helix domain-containing protein [Paenibacillus sp. J5C_2022]|uniref:helix-turn-helix transcriptional regulator n=1 Tax=Paenibacillus sp. J5C2022 TaxID=2977129 RepID=UPI0021CF16D2|nr:helix-turn-helix domain-containing protein [Paenibacillus sp. J5C2022]MCU6712829.1 helix-turn-helix domain-containing protein [Paenibacillus sp. J5C2022]